MRCVDEGRGLRIIDVQGERLADAALRHPEGKNDWKPHEKSMMFGYLVQLVASMPSWVAMHHSRV